MVNRKLTTLVSAVLLGGLSVFTYAGYEAKAQEAPAATTPSTPAPANLSKTEQMKLDLMKENVKAMDAQIDKIRQASDPKDRKKAVKELHEIMHETMMLGRMLTRGGHEEMMEKMMRQMGGGMQHRGGDKGQDADD
jgi:predicted secreted Zn-dependent protease